MENFRLKSTVAVNDKEFMVQTVNDSGKMAIVSSVFVDGEVLEVSRRPHNGRASEEEVLALVKSAHDEKKGELEQLLAAHDKALRGRDVDMMYHLGVAFHYKRLLEEAGSLLSSVLELKRDHHQAANILGMTRLFQGRHDEAVKALARAVELRPGYADYHNNYGEALLEAGFCRRAVEEFETARKLNIYYADAHFNLAIAYIANAIKREDFELYANLLDKTVDFLNRATAVAGDLKTAQFAEACAVLKQGDLQRALNLFKAVREQRREILRQEFSGLYLRFLLYLEGGGEKSLLDRISYLQEELKKNPTYVDLHHELALCYLHQATVCWRQGIEQLRETTAINPQLKKAENGLKLAEKFSSDLKTVVSDITRDDVQE
ncbi:MAG: tetratricopeptide repeat protein [candidate division Zixibacteria bacterium]|nr:tetratricopeptide repeat protein [candidate division Zixibacteria bacterium]